MALKLDEVKRNTHRNKKYDSELLKTNESSWYAFKNVGR